MATDYARMSEQLGRFYDFTTRSVLYVGAAGRQLLDPAKAAKVIAIDKNIEDLRELQKRVVESRLEESVEVRAACFEEITEPVDTVYFEFCLHEMAEPEKALAHAKSLATDIVVYDHSVGSEWVYYCVEEEKVRRSSEAMQHFGIRDHRAFQAEQQFGSEAELLAKVGSQGPLAVERAGRFAEATNIVIPFRYELDLL